MRVPLIAALLLSGCSLDSAGNGTFDEADAAIDSAQLADTTIGGADEDTAITETFVADTFVADTFVADTFVPDTFVPDTFVPDTFVPDTFMPDTFVPDTAKPDLGVDAGAPPCTEDNRGVYNGHCYFLVAASADWTGARDKCAGASLTGHPTHLAVITTVGEWSFVNGLPGGGTFGRWIGLSAVSPSSMKSAYTWVNGEAFSYDAWMSTEPNASGRCVVMHSAGFMPPGSWEDVSCSTNYYYVCERE
jgi:hypothetical protein